LQVDENQKHSIQGDRFQICPLIGELAREQHNARACEKAFASKLAPTREEVFQRRRREDRRVAARALG
jgi:hypothetical protein